jgi:hypothetical protein
LGKPQLTKEIQSLVEEQQTVLTDLNKAGLQLSLAETKEELSLLLEKYKSYSAKNSKDPLGYLFHGLLLRKIRLTEDGNNLIRKSFNMDPNIGLTLRLMGEISASESNFNQSLGYYFKAIELEPSNADFYFTLAETLDQNSNQIISRGILTESGVERQKLTAYRQALKYDSTNYVYALKLAIVYLESETYGADRALRILNQLKNRNIPQNILDNIHLQITKAYLLKSDLAEAKKYYSLIDPNNQTLESERNLVFRNISKLKEGKTVLFETFKLKESKALNPKNLNSFSEAVSTLHQSIQTNAKNEKLLITKKSKEISLLSRKVASLTKDLNNRENSLKSALTNEKALLKASKAKIAALQNLTNQMDSKNQSFQEKNTLLQKQQMEAAIFIQSMEKQVNKQILESRNKEKLFKDQYQNLQKELKNSLDSYEKFKSNQRSLSEDKKAAIFKLKNDLVSQQNLYQRSLLENKKLKERFSQLENKLVLSYDQLNEEIQLRRSLKSDFQSQDNKKQEQILRLELKIKKLDSEIKKQVESRLRTSKDLDASEDLVIKESQKFEKIKKELASRIQDLEEQKKRDQELIFSFEEKLKTANEIKKQSSMLKEQLVNELSSMKKAYQSKFEQKERLQKEAEAKILSLTQEKEQLLRDLGMAASQANQFKSNAQSELEGRNQELVQISKSIEVYKSRIKNVLNENEKLKGKLASEISEFSNQFERMSSQKKNLEVEISRLQNDFVKALDEKESVIISLNESLQKQKKIQKDTLLSLKSVENKLENQLKSSSESAIEYNKSLKKRDKGIVTVQKQLLKEQELVSNLKISKQELEKNVVENQKLLNGLYSELKDHKKNRDLLEIDSQAIIAKYESQLEQLRAKNVRFEQLKNKDLVDYRKQASKYEEQKKDLNLQVEFLEKAKTQLVKDQSKHLKQIDLLENKVITITNEKELAREQMEDAIASLEKKSAEFSSEKKSIQTILKELEKEQSDHQMDYNKIVKRLEKAEFELLENVKIKSTLEINLSALKKEISSQKTNFVSVQKKLEEELKNRSQNVEELKLEILQLSDSSIESNQKSEALIESINQELSRALSRLEIQKKETIQTVASLKKEQNDSIARLTKEKKMALAELNKTQKSLSESQLKIEKLVEEAELKREFFRSNILGLEDQLSLLNKRKDTLEIEFKNLKDSASKKDQISAKSITMKQKEIDSIYFELKNLKRSHKEMLENKNLKLTMLDKSFNEEQKKFKKIDNLLKNEVIKYERLKIKLAESEQSFQLQIQNLGNVNRDLVLKNQDSMNQIQALKKSLVSDVERITSKSKDELSALQISLDSSLSTVNGLKKLLQKSEDSMKDQESKWLLKLRENELSLEKANSANRDLTQQMELIKVRNIQESREKIAKFKKLNSEKSTLLKSKNDEIESLQIKLEDKESAIKSVKERSKIEIAALKKVVEESSKDIQSANRRIESLKAGVKELENLRETEKVSYENIIDQLSIKLSDSKASINDLKKSFSDLKVDTTRFSKELDKKWTLSKSRISELQKQLNEQEKLHLDERTKQDLKQKNLENEISNLTKLRKKELDSYAIQEKIWLKKIHEVQVAREQLVVELAENKNFSEKQIKLYNKDKQKLLSKIELIEAEKSKINEVYLSRELEFEEIMNDLESRVLESKEKSALAIEQLEKQFLSKIKLDKTENSKMIKLKDVEISKLIKEIEDFEILLNQSKKDSSEKELILSNLQDQLSSLSIKLNESSLVIKRLNIQLAGLNEEKESVDNQILNLKDILKSNKIENSEQQDNLKKKNSSLIAQISDLETEIDFVKKNADQSLLELEKIFTSKLKNERSNFENLDKGKNLLAQKLSLINNEKMEQKVLIEKLSKDLLRLNENLRSEKRISILKTSELETNLKNSEDRVRDLQESISSAKKSSQEKQKILNGLNAELSKLNPELKAFKNLTLDLETNLNKNIEEKFLLEKKIQNLQREFDLSSNNNSELTKKLKTQKQFFDQESERLIKELAFTKERAKSRLLETKNILSNQLKVKTLEFEDHLKMSEKSASASRERIQFLETTLSTLEENSREKQLRIEKLELSIKDTKSELLNEEKIRTDLLTQIEKSRQDFIALSRAKDLELSSQSSLLDDLKEEARQTESKANQFIVSLESQVNTKDLQINRLENQLSEMEQTFKSQNLELLEKVKAESSRVNRLGALLKKSKKTISILSKNSNLEISSLRSKLDALSLELKNQQKLTESIQSLKNKNKILETEHASNSKKISGQTSVLKENFEKIELLTNNLQSLKLQKNKDNEVISQLRTEISEQKSLLDEKTKSIRLLSNQVSVLEKDLVAAVNLNKKIEKSSADRIQKLAENLSLAKSEMNTLIKTAKSKENSLGDKIDQLEREMKASVVSLNEQRELSHKAKKSSNDKILELSERMNQLKSEATTSQAFLSNEISVREAKIESLQKKLVVQSSHFMKQLGIKAKIIEDLEFEFKYLSEDASQYKQLTSKNLEELEKVLSKEKKEHALALDSALNSIRSLENELSLSRSGFKEFSKQAEIQENGFLTQIEALSQELLVANKNNKKAREQNLIEINQVKSELNQVLEQKAKLEKTRIQELAMNNQLVAKLEKAFTLKTQELESLKKKSTEDVLLLSRQIEDLENKRKKENFEKQEALKALEASLKMAVSERDLLEIDSNKMLASMEKDLSQTRSDLENTIRENQDLKLQLTLQLKKFESELSNTQSKLLKNEERMNVISLKASDTIAGLRDEIKSTKLDASKSKLELDRKIASREATIQALQKSMRIELKEKDRLIDNSLNQAIQLEREMGSLKLERDKILKDKEVSFTSLTKQIKELKNFKKEQSLLLKEQEISFEDELEKTTQYFNSQLESYKVVSNDLQLKVSQLEKTLNLSQQNLENSENELLVAKRKQDETIDSLKTKMNQLKTELSEKLKEKSFIVVSKEKEIADLKRDFSKTLELSIKEKSTIDNALFSLEKEHKRLKSEFNNEILDKNKSMDALKDRIVLVRKNRQESEDASNLLISELERSLNETKKALKSSVTKNELNEKELNGNIQKLELELVQAIENSSKIMSKNTYLKTSLKKVEEDFKEARTSWSKNQIIVNKEIETKRLTIDSLEKALASSQSLQIQSNKDFERKIKSLYKSLKSEQVKIQKISTEKDAEISNLTNNIKLLKEKSVLSQKNSSLVLKKMKSELFKITNFKERELEVAKTQSSKLKVTLEKAQSEKIQTEKQNQNIIDSLLGDISKYQNEIQKLKKEKLEEDSTNDQKVKDFIEKIAVLEKNIKTVKSVKDLTEISLNKQILSLEQSLKSSESTKDVLITNHKSNTLDLQQQLEKATQDSITYQNQLKEDLNNQRKLLSSVEKQKKDDLFRFNNNIESLKLEIVQLNKNKKVSNELNTKMIDELNNQLTQTQEQFNEQVRLRSEERELFGNELAKLKDELKSTLSKLDSANEKNVDLNTMFTLKMDEMDSLIAQKKKLIFKSENEIKEHKNTIQNLEIMLSKNQKLYQNLELKLEEDLEFQLNSIDESKKTISYLNDKLQEAKLKNISLQQNTEKEKSEIFELNSRVIMELKDQLAGLQSKLSQQEQTMMDQQLIADNKLGQLRADFDKNKSALQLALKKRDEMEVDYSFQVDKLEKELDDKIELISKSSDTIFKQSKTIQLLEKSFEEKQKFFKITETDLKNDLNLHVKSLDKSKKTIALLDRQISKSKKEFADSRALHSKKVKELEDRIVFISKEQVESEEQYKKSLNLSKSVLNEVHKTTKKQMDLANENIRNLKSAVNDKQSIIVKNQTKADQFIKELNIKMASYQSQIEDLKSDVSKAQTEKLVSIEFFENKLSTSNSLLNDLEDKKSLIEKEMNLQIQTLSQSLENEKKNREKIVSEYKLKTDRIAQEFKSSQSLAIRDRKAHVAEMDLLRNQLIAVEKQKVEDQKISNELIAKLNDEILERESRLKEQLRLTNELEKTKRSQFKTLEESLLVAKENLEIAKMDFAMKSENSEIQIKNLNTELSDQSLKYKNSSKELSLRQKIIVQLEKEMESLKFALIVSEKKVADLLVVRNQMDQLQKRFDIKLKDANSLVDSLTRELQASEKKNEILDESILLSNSKHSKELQVLKDELKQSSISLSKLKLETDKSASLKSNELKNLKNQFIKSEQAYLDYQINMADQVKKLEKSLQEALNVKSIVERELKSYIASLEEKLKVNVQRLVSAEELLGTENSKSEKRIQELEKKINNGVNLLNSANQLLSQQKKSHSSVVDQLEIQLKDLKEQSKTIIATKDQEIKNIRKDVSNIQKIMEENLGESSKLISKLTNELTEALAQVEFNTKESSQIQENLRLKIMDYKQEVAELEMLRSKSSQESLSMEKDLKANAKKIAQLENYLNVTRQALHNAKTGSGQIISKLQKDLQSSESQRAKLTIENSELVKSKDGQIRKLEQRLSDVIVDLKVAQKSEDRFSQESSELVSSLRDQLETSKAQFEQILASQNKRESLSIDRIKDLEKRLMEAQNNFAGVNNQLMLFESKSKASSGEMKTQLILLEKELVQLKASNTESKKLDGKIIEKLQVQLEEKSEELTLALKNQKDPDSLLDLQRKIGAMEAANLRLEKMLIKEQFELNELMTELDSSENEILKLNKGIQSQEIVIKKLESEINKKASALKIALKNQKDPNLIMDLQKKIQETENALLALSNAKEMDQKSILELTEKLKLTNEQIATLSVEKSSVSENLTKQVEILRLELANKDKDFKSILGARPTTEELNQMDLVLNRVNKDYLKLQEETAQKEKSLVILKDQLKSLEQQLVSKDGSMNLQLASKDQSISEFKEKIESLNKELLVTREQGVNASIVERLQLDILEMRKVNQQYIDLNTRNEVAIQGLKDQLSDSERKIKDLEVARALLIREKEKNDKNLKAVKDQVSSTVQSLNQSEPSPESLNKIDSLQQRVNQLERNRKNLDQRIAESSRTVQAEDEKLDKYRNELSKALKDLEKAKSALKSVEAKYIVDTETLKGQLKKSELGREEISKFMNDTREMTKSLKLSLDKSQKRILELDKVRIDLAIQENSLTGGQGEIAVLLKALDRELSKVINDLNFNSAALNLFLQMFKPRN